MSHAGRKYIANRHIYASCMQLAARKLRPILRLARSSHLQPWGGVENRVRVIHMGGFTETMVFFDLHTHPKIFGLPDRHLVSKRDFGHRAGNF